MLNGFHGLVVDRLRQPLRRSESGRLAASSMPSGRPQQVIRCKHPVIAMPMLARLRDEIGEPIQRKTVPATVFLDGCSTAWS